MKNKQKTIFAISLILAAMLFAFVTFKQQAQTSNSNQANQQDQEQPTEVQDGVKTKRQQEHGKRFNGYTATKLRDLINIASNIGDGEITLRIEPPMTLIEPNAPPFDPQRFLQEIGCDADAVIIGETKSKTSQITENDDFIFTDYDIEVNQVLKNNPRSPVNSGNSITVTRIGGKIKYRGRVITALDKSFRPFKKNNLYLLFLKYIPETDSYQAFSNGSFHLENNKPKPLGGKSKVVGEMEDISQFVNQVSAALSSPCNNNSETGFRLQ